MRPKKRESRIWWVVNDGVVTQAEGLSCAPDNPDVWWFPASGYSMTEGVHVFPTRVSAVAKARADLSNLQSVLAHKLFALEQS